MALTATIYNFDVDLSDSDRHVYESLSLRLAQHPSESPEYLMARLLAYLLNPPVARLSRLGIGRRIQLSAHGNR